MSDMASMLAGAIAAGVSQRLARSLVVGFSECREEQRPLTELQQIDLVAAALLCFEGCAEEVASHLRIDALLHTQGVFPEGGAPDA